MDLLSSINLPHWLMIAGAILVAMSFLGLVFYPEQASRNES